MASVTRSISDSIRDPDNVSCYKRNLVRKAESGAHRSGRMVGRKPFDGFVKDGNDRLLIYDEKQLKS